MFSNLHIKNISDALIQIDKGKVVKYTVHYTGPWCRSPEPRFIKYKRHTNNTGFHGAHILNYHIRAGTGVPIWLYPPPPFSIPPVRWSWHEPTSAYPPVRWSWFQSTGGGGGNLKLVSTYPLQFQITLLQIQTNYDCRSKSELFS